MVHAKEKITESQDKHVSTDEDRQTSSLCLNTREGGEVFEGVGRRMIDL